MFNIRDPKNLASKIIYSAGKCNENISQKTSQVIMTSSGCPKIDLRTKSVGQHIEIDVSRPINGNTISNNIHKGQPIEMKDSISL